MKLLLSLLLLAGALFAANPPKIDTCFKVVDLLRADEDHFWANWKNTCPYTIDQVYVMTDIYQHGTKVGTTMWPMYFVTPGQARIVRFTTSKPLAADATLKVYKITTDPGEALHY